MKKKLAFDKPYVIKDLPVMFGQEPFYLVKNILLDFYKEQGWNPRTQTLSVKSVFVSQNTYDKMYEIFKSIPGVDEGELAALMLNYGPAVREGIEDNQVILLEDAIINDELEAI